MSLLFFLSIWGLFSSSDKSITVRASIVPASPTGVCSGGDGSEASAEAGSES